MGDWFCLLGAMEVVQQAWGWLDERITAEVHSLWRWGSGTELTSTSSTRGLPFVDSPAPIVVAVTIYLTIVIGGLLWINANNLKPREKEPAPLQALVLVHNLFCFALSLYMCVGIIREAIFHKYVTLVVVVTLPDLTLPSFAWNCVVAGFGVGFDFLNPSRDLGTLASSVVSDCYFGFWMVEKLRLVCGPKQTRLISIQNVLIGRYTFWGNPYNPKEKKV